MAQITRYFAGANGGDGFQNLFPEITDLERTYDLIILKGGAGVGKNTFMREIADTMDRAGVAAEHFFCSGDPDSLDAVFFPQLRCAICDGTSPHVVEPKYPAAVDRYLDLGRFYDLAAAKLMADEVKAYTKDCSRCYAAAYRCLRAARELERETVAAARETFDEARARKRLEGIVRREIRGKGSGRGRVRRRFLSSITHKGAICFFESAETLCPKIYALSDRYERAGAWLTRLSAEATARNYDVILCPSGEDVSRPEHLLIPELGVAFLTSKTGMEY
ncbi:MAG: hypothetical protein IKN53_04245, partial [Oscillibacter sp.]|nr:hypothetical protein [Oscillibacter sp.]